MGHGSRARRPRRGREALRRDPRARGAHGRSPSALGRASVVRVLPGHLGADRCRTAGRGRRPRGRRVRRPPHPHRGTLRLRVGPGLLQRRPGARPATRRGRDRTRRRRPRAGLRSGGDEPAADVRDDAQRDARPARTPLRVEGRARLGLSARPGGVPRARGIGAHLQRLPRRAHGRRIDRARRRRAPGSRSGAAAGHAQHGEDRGRPLPGCRAGDERALGRSPRDVRRCPR